MTKIEALTDLHQQALDAAREEGRRAGLEEACAKLQEAADDWRSDGCDLPAKHIEDEIPLIRALIDKPADPVAEAKDLQGRK